MDEGSGVLLGKYFSDSGKRQCFYSVARSTSCLTPVPQRICQFEKRSLVLRLWPLLATPRVPKGTFSFVSAVRGISLEEFEKLPNQGQLYWYGGLYNMDWEIQFVIHKLPGKKQTAEGFERMVGCVVRAGDSPPFVGQFSSSVFFSVLLHEKLCSILVGRALALNGAHMQGHCGPHGRSACSIFFCSLFCVFLPVLELFLFQFFLSCYLWSGMLIELKRSRLEWCM